VRSWVKPSGAANENLIDRTCQIWGPRLGRDLSSEDARQIAENVTSFFALLAEWSRAGHSGTTGDTCMAAVSDNEPTQ
jgi:hypothetical protein